MFLENMSDLTNYINAPYTCPLDEKRYPESLHIFHTNLIHSI